MYSLFFGNSGGRPRGLAESYYERQQTGAPMRASGSTPCGDGDQGADKRRGGAHVVVVHSRARPPAGVTEREVNYVEDNGPPQDHTHVASVHVVKAHRHPDGTVHADRHASVTVVSKCKHCGMPWKRGACHACSANKRGGTRYYAMTDYDENVCDADDGNVVHRTKAVEASFEDVSGRTVPAGMKPKTVVGVSRHKDKHKTTVAACRTGRTSDGKLKIDCAAVAAETIDAADIDPTDPPVRKCPQTGVPLTFEGARVLARAGGARVRHIVVHVRPADKPIIDEAQRIIDELCASANVHHQEVFSKLRNGEHWGAVKRAIVTISNDVVERRGVDERHSKSVLGRIRNAIVRVAKYALDFAHVRKHHRRADKSVADAAQKLEAAKKVLEDALVEASDERYRIYIADRIQAFAVALRYILMFPDRCASQAARDITANEIEDNISQIYKPLST